MYTYSRPTRPGHAADLVVFKMMSQVNLEYVITVQYYCLLNLQFFTWKVGSIQFYVISQQWIYFYSREKLNTNLEKICENDIVLYSSMVNVITDLH